MNNIFRRFKETSISLYKKGLQHKIISLIIVGLLVAGVYYAYGIVFPTTVQTKYVLAAVERGTLVSSISGSGQVSASTQLDIKPKVSGDVVSVPVTSGQQVKAGTLLVALDSTDAQKTVRDAQSALDSAKLSLAILQEPADQLSLTQSENALAQAQQDKQTAQNNLAKAYDDGFSSVAGAFVDLPGVVSGVNDILSNPTINASAFISSMKIYVPNTDIFRTSAVNSFTLAQTAYNTNIQDYTNSSRYSSTSTIDSLINETYSTTKSISEALKDTKNFLDLLNNSLTDSSLNKSPAVLALVTTYEANMQTYISTTDSHLTDLLNMENTIKSDKNAIANASSTISEDALSLAKLKAGADPLSVQSQQLAVQQKQNALSDAQETLADYAIRAPFDGVVAKVNVIKGDSASSGTAVVTMITNQGIADMSLNEVDIAKIKIGQKATLTFDAVPDLTITGTVAEMDTIGTVTQGVVIYNVQIAFATQDSRVKPGMSATASIITDVKPDVLLVPSSAIKTQGAISYVQMLDSVASSTAALSSQGITSNTPPRNQVVEVGSSNDTLTEITGGLSEGDLIVSRIIIGSATAAKTTTQSGGLSIPGLGGAGGGAFRAATGR
jgi:HlyD family secretion protein